jgi:hypothetical protein
MKALRSQALHQKKPGKRQRVDMEIKELSEAGIAPDETHSQDADRHDKSAHQKSGSGHVGK